MKQNTKPKYLMVMDLDDADSDVREAESALREIEKEKEILEKWGFGSEIPSELWGEINSRRKKVLLLKEEVKRLEEKLKNFDKEIKTDLKMPDELEELKNRLRLELDSDITDRVIDEWYEEYQDDYEKLIVNAEDIERPTRNSGIDEGVKDEVYWRNWALQNIS